MNKHFENMLGMIKAVDKLCDQHAAIVAGMPAFDSSRLELKAKLSEIELTAMTQLTDIKGVSLDKKNARRKLAKTGARVGAAVAAYADSTGNEQLREETNYTESELFRSRDDVMIEYCQIIYDRASTNIAQLGNYGVDAALMTQLQTEIADCEAKNPSTMLARERRKVYTEKLRQLFNEARHILNSQMDKTSLFFEAQNGTFFELFKAARNIYDMKGKTEGGEGEVNPKGVIMGYVFDNGSGDAIESAIVEIVEANLKTDTDEYGEFYFEEVPTGSYTIKVQKDTYDLLTENNVKLEKDDELSKDFVMKASSGDDGSGSNEVPIK